MLQKSDAIATLLNGLCAALERKYQTPYAWRPMVDYARWIFVPSEANKPMWTVLMQDLIRTRCVNVNTLLGYLQPYSTTPHVEAPDRLACRQCGAQGLEHWYTSKRDQTTLCPACFAARQDKQMAKEDETLPIPDDHSRSPHWNDDEPSVLLAPRTTSDDAYTVKMLRPVWKHLGGV